MPTVDGNAAAQLLLSWGTCDPGYCLRYVWDAYAAQGATSSQSYPTAYSAWLGSGGQHPGDFDPPAGVPVYLGPRSDNAAGDVMISLGGGMCAATDWPYNGVIGTCSIQQRLNQTARPYLGWTDNMLGNPILQVQSPANGKEQDMFIAIRNGAWYLILPAENGMLFASVLGGQDSNSGFAQVTFNWDSSWQQLRSRLVNPQNVPA